MLTFFYVLKTAPQFWACLPLSVILLLTSYACFEHFTCRAFQLCHTRFSHETAGTHFYKGFLHGRYALSRHACEFHFSHASTSAAERAEGSLLLRGRHLDRLGGEGSLQAHVTTCPQYYLSGRFFN